MGYSREQAEEALQHESADGGLRDYFTAIIEGRLPEYYLGLFQHKKADYLDDLPSVDVRTLISGNELTRYKCQINFVFGLELDLRAVLRDEVIKDEGLRGDIEIFLESDLHFRVGDSGNPERLGRINDVLDKVIGHLTPATAMPGVDPAANLREIPDLVAPSTTN